MITNRFKKSSLSKPTSESLTLRPTTEKPQRSLFGEILDWMLAPLLLLWPLSIAITYLVAKSIANQPFDHALEAKVMVLSQQIKVIDEQLISELSWPARDILRADDMDVIYFQIQNHDGEILEGEMDLPAPSSEDRPALGTVNFRNVLFRGVDIRIAYTYINLQKKAATVSVKEASKTNEETKDAPYALVQIAETLEKRNTLANDIIKGVILPQFFILPIALALVWFALSRGLSPLADLQRRIRARQPEDLSPIDSHHVPEEISPLVGSLNDMLARLSQTIDTQKRFIADAAHQMKTPLAGLRMQSELALRQTDQNEIQRSLLQLSKSSEAATRLVNQLLALARAENNTSVNKAFAVIDLCELVKNAVHEWIPMTFNHKIDLGLERPDYPVEIFGDAIMLRELVNNLIENALHYTPSGMNVTARIRIDEEQALAIVEVEDNGPGIPKEEQQKVFDRFYRILGSKVPGSGLGLAIVREIAQQHDARIEIVSNLANAPKESIKANPNPAFPGCIFRVYFSMKPQNNVLDSTP
ncbi:MAG: sensor histidine kinase N-terminal domain-containing protein [Undibacterium sp.]|nr:sensor histidine kinase N-terminal domain-containing protein [Undibacterium sp.]